MKRILFTLTFLFSFVSFGQENYSYYAGLDLKSFQELKQVNYKIDFSNIDIELLAAAIFHATNIERKKHKRPLFTHSKALFIAAQAHSREMVDYDYFSHTSPVIGRRSMSNRLKKVGLVNGNFAEINGCAYNDSKIYVASSTGLFSADINSSSLFDYDSWTRDTSWAWEDVYYNIHAISNSIILGGNKNSDSNLPDTQNATMIYNIKDRKFELSHNLNSKRWYGSIVRTGDDKMIIMGGKDAVTANKISIVPEILDLKNFNKGWRYLNKAKSEDLFGGEPDWGEWFYPRAFLASDGNIVWISYNKTWVMDSSNDYRISKTGEIPLVTSGISRIMEHKKPHKDGEKSNVEKLKLLTIGSAVGAKNSVVMIEKDKILVFGGRQYGDEYSPSNKVFSIDFSNSLKPKIKEINAMNFARSQGDATILPNGNIFLNGGHSYNDHEFSNFIPEIYNPNTEISNEMDESYFRRNYHASSLLLPDGRILTAGGDVWNAEFFYPPYLFTKDINDKTVLAKRPQIMNLDKDIKRGEKVEIEVNGEISKVNLISTGSTTHAQGSESKFRNINFTKVSNDKIEIQLDNNSNDLQNGTYLLFVLNSKGTPSEGKIVFVN